MFLELLARGGTPRPPHHLKIMEMTINKEINQDKIWCFKGNKQQIKYVRACENFCKNITTCHSYQNYKHLKGKLF